MKYLLVLAGFVLGEKLYAQADVDSVLHQQHRVSLEAYVDAYYSYDFNKPKGSDRPYFVSSARHNELTVNLAYIALNYSSSRLRGRLAPGVGTYMNANYANEPGTLKNIVEASAGVRLFPKKNIWLDAGIFGSPYTNESAISRDHISYTRSFAPEYVPYYLAGVKVSVPFGERWTATIYLVNGWQQIADVNSGKSVGTQVEFRPTSKWSLNWTTYTGDESSAALPENGVRFFNDFYFIYKSERWSATGCAYVGLQNRASGKATWWQANLQGKYHITSKASISARIEYFDDPKSVQIVPITPVAGFSAASSSAGLNFQVTDKALIRLEGRTFWSAHDVYLKAGVPSKTSNLITTNFTIWF